VTEIEYVVGDAVYPGGPGRKIVAHVVNDQGGWGAGFVIALSRRWQEPEKVYRATWPMFSLGSVQLVPTGDDVYVANLYAQNGYMGRTNPQPLQYESLRHCLTHLALSAKRMGASVHMPRIGCGLGGGDWSVVSEIISHTLCNTAVPVTVYDLKGSSDGRS
jgi:O-acetyl-ADP-ribose deacetylase (regulator of RNase III)